MYFAQTIIRTKVSTCAGEFEEIRILKHRREHRIWGKWQLFDYECLHLFKGKHIISLSDFEKAEELFSMRISRTEALTRVKSFYAFENELQGAIEAQEDILKPLYEAYDAKVNEEISVLQRKLSR